MGGGMSIEQKNNQDIEADITQETSARCIVTQKATQKINVTIDTSNVSNASFGNTITSNESSCALKSSLNSKVLNNLKDKQGATQIDVPGLFTALNSLTGNQNNINQANSQLISNQASQLINSLCQNNKFATQDVSLRIVNSTVNGFKVNNIIGSNKFNCIIQNTSSYFNQNSESNTQTATQVKIDSMIFIILIIVIGVVAVLAMKYGFERKNKNKNESDSQEKTILKDESKLLNNTSKKATIFNPTYNKGLRVQ